MTPEFRALSPLDRLLSVMDQGLRVSFAAPSAVSGSGRPLPRPATDTPLPPLDAQIARESAALMRVNHAGEVAAQALYHGQALVAADATTRDFLLAAALEEGDHLHWCAQRLKELGSHPSRLNPLWYAGSVAIGALAGVLGDRISLGFIAETERQVEGHLDQHLAQLSASDAQTRTILEQMKQDEARHGAHALEHGGAALPAAVTHLMRLTAKVMTVGARVL